jgi:hypothetical protein
MGAYGHWLYQIPLYATFESSTRKALPREIYSRAINNGQKLELIPTVTALLARL